MIFRRHYLIIIIAFCIGCLSSLPQYLATRSVPQFNGIYRGVTDDIIYYEARVRDVLDGHIYLSNPYLYEYKDGFPMQFWIPDYILAQPIQWFGLSVPVGFIVWTFFIVAILIFLTYGILYTLTLSSVWSVLGSVALYLGLFPTTFVRLPSPGLNLIFWLLTFLFLVLYIKTHRYRYVIASSIAFGLLFYIYPYYWTFYVVFFAIFTTLLFFNEYFSGTIVYTKKIILIIIGGCVFSIPYFISLIRSSQLPEYNETLARIGLIQTHFPSGIDSVFIMAVVVFVCICLCWRKIVSVNMTSIFLFSGVVATGIVTNQHLVTGKNLEFSSHYFLSNVFWCFITIMYFLYQWFSVQSEKIKKTMCICVCIVVFIFSCIGIQKLISQQTIYNEGEIYFENYAPIFTWLNQNTRPDDVVYSGDDISYLLPIYTSLNTFYNPFSILFFMTNTEVENRFILSHYFDVFDREYVLLRQRFVFGGYYINEYGHNGSKNKIRKLFRQPTVDLERVPTDILDSVVDHAHTIQKKALLPQLKKYKVDYVVWDSVKEPHWKVASMKGLKLVYSANGIFVYKII